MFLSMSIIPLGLNLVESYPYETVQRDYDYVRLASITAGKFTDSHLPLRCFILIYPTYKMLCSSKNTILYSAFPGSMPKANIDLLCS